MKTIISILIALSVVFSVSSYAQANESLEHDYQSDQNEIFAGFDFNKPYSEQEITSIKEKIVSHGLFSKISLDVFPVNNKNPSETQLYNILSITGVVSNEWEKDYKSSHLVGSPQFNLLMKMFSIKYNNNIEKSGIIYNNRIASIFKGNNDVDIHLSDNIDIKPESYKHTIIITYYNRENERKAKENQKEIEENYSTKLIEKYNESF